MHQIVAQYFRLIGLAFLLLACFGSIGQAASFACDKAATETEITICADAELSALDSLMGTAWKRLDQNAHLEEQRNFLMSRDACADNTCLRDLMGARVGELLAISEGLQERIKETPFRSVPSQTVFVKCRRNYQGADTLKYAELLFSFEEDGPTFKETNIVLSGDHSESIWGWFIWNASASTEEIITSDHYSQVVLRRNYTVTPKYISSLRDGIIFSWIIYEDRERGAAFLTHEFSRTADVRKCLEILDQL